LIILEHILPEPIGDHSKPAYLNGAHRFGMVSRATKRVIFVM